MNIWKDNWVTDKEGKMIKLENLGNNSDFCLVKDLMNDNGWNIKMLSHCLSGR